MNHNKIFTGVFVLTLSTAAQAAPANSCQPFDAFAKTCNLTNLAGYGQECIQGFQKGAMDAWNHEIAKPAQEATKFVGDMFDAKKRDETFKKAGNDWNNFTSSTGSAITKGINNMVASWNSGAMQTGVQDWWQKSTSSAYNYMSKKNAVNDSLAAGAEAVKTMMPAMMLGIAKTSYESRCQITAANGARRGSRYAMVDSLSRILEESAYAEGASCKTSYVGCPTCSAVQTAVKATVCAGIAGGAAWVAIQGAFFLAPGGLARYGKNIGPIAEMLAGALAKSGAWGSKTLLAGAKAVNLEKEAIAVGEGLHAAGTVAHGAAVKTGAAAAGAAAAVANNAAVQKVAQAGGAAMHAVNNIPGIKQFNKIQDNIAEAILDTGEKVAFKVSGGKIKPDSLMMKNKLTDFMAKNPGAKLVPVAKGGKAGLDLVKDGKVVESFEATNGAGQTMTWDEFEGRYGKDLEKIAGKSKVDATNVLNIPNVPKRQLVTGDAVKGKKDSKYIKAMTDAQKNALIGKIGRKPSPGETLANEMAALSEKGGKKMAYTEKLPRSAEDDMAHLFRDGEDVTEITEEGLMAADRGIINEAREKKGLPPLKEEDLDGLDAAAKRAKHEKMLKEQPEEVTEEAELIAKKKAQAIKDCEDCVKRGVACTVNMEKLEKVIDPTGH